MKVDKKWAIPDLYEHYSSRKDELTRFALSKDHRAFISLLGQKEQCDKFIVAKIENGLNLLLSLPREEFEFHEDLVDFITNQLSLSVLDAKGGYIRDNGDELRLFGDSEQYGKADFEKARRIIASTYPGVSVSYEDT